ncbi:MAG: hypothetical protein JRD02_12465 [Deltaproteobacteria bacterium]|nr:hypothetical protein [Deltaproteobacteria bacterium]
MAKIQNYKRLNRRFLSLNIDRPVKSQKTSFFVIPSRIGVRDDGQAGIQCFQKLMNDLDPGCSLSRTVCGAGVTTFYECINIVV